MSIIRTSHYKKTFVFNKLRDLYLKKSSKLYTNDLFSNKQMNFMILYIKKKTFSAI